MAGTERWVERKFWNERVVLVWVRAVGLVVGIGIVDRGGRVGEGVDDGSTPIVV